MSPPDASRLIREILIAGEVMSYMYAAEETAEDDLTLVEAGRPAIAGAGRRWNAEAA